MKTPTCKSIALCLYCFNLAKKHLYLKKTVRAILRLPFLKIYLYFNNKESEKGLGRNHINAYRIWKKNEYKHCAQLIISSNEKHVSTKFLLNISIFKKLELVLHRCYPKTWACSPPRIIYSFLLTIFYKCFWMIEETYHVYIFYLNLIIFPKKCSLF